MTVLLGINTIENCDAILIVNGIEVFRLRERAGDGQLVCDFEIRDQDGQMLAKIAKNNVVHAADGYTQQHLPSGSFVLDAEGKTVAGAEEESRDTIRLSGDFWVGTYHVVITAEKVICQTPVGGRIEMTGSTVKGFNGAAIELKPNSYAIGVSRPQSKKGK